MDNHRESRKNLQQAVNGASSNQIESKSSFWGEDFSPTARDRLPKVNLGTLAETSQQRVNWLTFGGSSRKALKDQTRESPIHCQITGPTEKAKSLRNG
jgi:hypothetical protein